MSTRRTLTAAIGALCLMVAVRNLILGLPLVERLSQAGLKDTTFAFIALVGALGLTVVLLLMLGGWFLHMGISRKALLDRATRYVITNQRVILQRGRQELHIDRAIIVDIADRDGLYGGRDAYLILDGPQARALSAQGAFGPGERARGFRPLLQGLTEDEVQTLRTELFRTRIDPRQEAEDHVPSTTAVGTDQEQNT